MQAVHETGHVIGALVSGGTIERVVLHPLTISRTGLSRNPHPLGVAWAGPLCGMIIPIFIWAIADYSALPGASCLRFFAGFCLIANGAYLAIGSIDQIGDAGELVRLGAPKWLLWSVGGVAMTAGLWLWHGQGKHFGLGREARPISRSVSYGCLLAFLILLAFGLMFGMA
jgi:hypothetical protein